MHAERLRGADELIDHVPGDDIPEVDELGMAPDGRRRLALEDRAMAIERTAQTRVPEVVSLVVV
jgi:hypothetical protein